MHTVTPAHHGCPLADVVSSHHGPCTARAKHVLSPVVDGGLQHDEYTAINSICRSDPAEDFEEVSSCPVGGEAIHNLSAQRIPHTFADARLRALSSSKLSRHEPAHSRVLGEDALDTSGAPTIAHDAGYQARAEAMPSPLSAGWRKHVRSRDLRLSACMRRRPVREEVHCAVVASELAQPECSPVAEALAPPGFEHLSTAQIAELQALIERYDSEFSSSSDDMGCVPEKYREFFLQLPTADGQGCIQRPYRLSFKEKEEFKRQLANLLEKGVIKKATGPTNFVSPVLFVPKPRDPTALRMCVDFRRLNAVTKRDLHELPDVRTLLQQMRGCKFFSALDLSSGFWALPIAEEDQHKTAFTGPDGNVYVWTKAAMGLSNSPAAFQRFMAHVMRGIRGVSVYIDDVTIFSKSWKEHLAILAQVFERARDAGLKFKFSKCIWAAAECRVLGSIVNEQGILPDPDKTAAIEQLPVPRNSADVRSFLGATGYFHEHVPQYAHKSEPLRQLLKKGVPFVWSDACQDAFETLKRDLASESVLRMPDVSKPFILTTDWSKAAVGAVLSQLQPERPDDPQSPTREYVISYASRALNPAESNYAPTEGECLALVWATRKFRQYLHGQNFTVRTDHAALKWLSTARFENSKLERWAMRLQEFTFEVEYLPGPDNVVADHLSRHVACAHLQAGSVKACAGHLGYAIANKVMDIVTVGGNVMNPNDWSRPDLAKLWQDGAAEDIAREPCWACGEEEGHANMVLCDTCGRPYHLQCCHPPRTVVPDGEWHCHECDEAFSNVAEFERTEDPILFPRGNDPFHPEIAEQVALYVHSVDRNLRLLQRADGAESGRERAQARTQAEQAAAAALLTVEPDAGRRRRIRALGNRLRVHPTQPEWFMQREQLASNEEVWLALPPPRYRWGLIGAYHDRTGHAGINNTTRALRQHFSWPHVKADVRAWVQQCHPCQLRRLEQECSPSETTPEMSAPFQHVHIDLAGPFVCRTVKEPASAPRRKGSLSTQAAGSNYVCLIVDYFTKATELIAIPDKSSATVARAFHDRWLMRYGAPEWLTSDNGVEFAGAFKHQLARFGIDHVTTSAYHPQSNGAAERLVRTMKTILAAKVAGAVHDWRALLPQIQAEYMGRSHASTGVSPNELVYAHKIYLPPPVGALQPRARTAAQTVEEKYLEQRSDRYDALVEAALSRLCAAQDRNLERQKVLLQSKAPARPPRQLRVGDLAYLKVPKGRKTAVRGPFVVTALSHTNSHESTVNLQTTGRVEGQEPRAFKVHRDQVARCTTVVDVLEDLLREAGLSAERLTPPAPHRLAVWHTDASGGVT